jgi:hypothetical protein
MLVLVRLHGSGRRPPPVSPGMNAAGTTSAAPCRGLFVRGLFVRGLLLLLAAVALPARAARAEGCISGCIAGTAADEFTADRAGLVREWIVQLPTATGVTGLEHVVVGDGLVVAQTRDGTAHAIRAAAFGDAERQAGPQLVPPQESSAALGSLLWSRRLPSFGGPLAPAAVGPDLVVVPHEDRIAGLERETGQIRWDRALGRHPAGGPAAIGNWIYAPLTGSDVMRFPVNPVRQPPQPTLAEEPKKQGKAAAKKARKKREENLEPVKLDAGGRPQMAPVPLADGVLWCTADGLLVTLQPAERDWNRLEFALENPPVGPPVVRGRSIFAATTTGDLARIDLPRNARAMELAWHVVLPGDADAGPFVAGNTVVVSLGEEGLAAYAADTGTELWRTCLPGRILAAGGDRVWVLDRVGRLSGFDLADGTRREVLCLGPFTEPIVNLRTDRLLLASPQGTLVSLAPKSSRAVPAAATEPAAEPANKEPAAESPAEEEPVEPGMPDENMPAEEEAV